MFIYNVLSFYVQFVKIQPGVTIIT